MYLHDLEDSSLIPGSQSTSLFWKWNILFWNKDNSEKYGNNNFLTEITFKRKTIKWKWAIYLDYLILVNLFNKNIHIHELCITLLSHLWHNFTSQLKNKSEISEIKIFFSVHNMRGLSRYQQICLINLIKQICSPPYKLTYNYWTTISENYYGKIGYLYLSSLPPVNKVEEQWAKLASSYVICSQHCIGEWGRFLSTIFKIPIIFSHWLFEIYKKNEVL